MHSGLGWLVRNSLYRRLVIGQDILTLLHSKSHNVSLRSAVENLQLTKSPCTKRDYNKITGWQRMSNILHVSGLIIEENKINWHFLNCWKIQNNILKCISFEAGTRLIWFFLWIASLIIYSSLLKMYICKHLVLGINLVFFSTWQLSSLARKKKPAMPRLITYSSRITCIKPLFLLLFSSCKGWPILSSCSNHRNRLPCRFKWFD